MLGFHQKNVWIEEEVGIEGYPLRWRGPAPKNCAARRGGTFLAQGGRNKQQQMHNDAHEVGEGSGVMNVYQAGKPACEHCIHWEGKRSSYLGNCDHPTNRPSRVPFDYSCRLYAERKPILSLQSLVRGQPMTYYKR